MELDLNKLATEVLECPTCLVQLDTWLEDPAFTIAGMMTAEKWNLPFHKAIALFMMGGHLRGHPSQEAMFAEARRDRARRWN